MNKKETDNLVYYNHAYCLDMAIWILTKTKASPVSEVEKQVIALAIDYIQKERDNLVHIGDRLTMQAERLQLLQDADDTAEQSLVGEVRSSPFSQGLISFTGVVPIAKPKSNSVGGWGKSMRKPG